nr:response regulator [Geothermobacter hydrogeniphilus]
MKLLLVEDDAMIGKVMLQGLVQEGHVVDWARSAVDASMALRIGRYEMVLLDLGLPDGSGLEVLTNYRHGGGDAAVIIVTTQDAVAERIAGLDAGADDFVTKPFDLDELGARMRVVQRRRHGRIDPLLVYGSLSLNPATKVCRLQSKQVS